MIERIWDKRDEDIFEGLKTLNVKNYILIYWFLKIYIMTEILEMLENYCLSWDS